MGDRRARRLAACGVVMAVLAASQVLGAAPAVAHESVHVELVQTRWARGLTDPTGMTVTPDGRVFVTQQDGTIRVFRDGHLLPEPFAQLKVATGGTDGLLGVTHDPNFVSNGWLYVYATTVDSYRHNRIIRLRADGDRLDPESPVELFTLPEVRVAAVNHHGGDLAFGADGKLYVAVGDANNAVNGQDLTTPFGSILRLNPDGTIPADNPFLGVTTGSAAAIWAYGFRNPYRTAIDPTTGLLYVNDVGARTWEEVNQVVAGANHGWPTEEGPSTRPDLTGPLVAYNHSVGDYTGCAATGIAVNRAATNQLGTDLDGAVLFADFCGSSFDIGSWIRAVQPDTGEVHFLHEGINTIVDLGVADDGTILVLSRDVGGALFALTSAESGRPIITQQPTDLQFAPGGSATLSVSAAGSNLSYQWFVDGAAVPGATATSLVVDDSFGVGVAGSLFSVEVASPSGVARSNDALVRLVSPGESPVVEIIAPVAGTAYSGGQTFNVDIAASDPEDGVCAAASSIRWKVDFHHDLHLHPFLPWTSLGDKTSFTIPTTGEAETNVWYRIHAEVVDSTGRVTTVTRDLDPRIVTVSLATDPPDIAIVLDGQVVATPHEFPAVVGTERNITASPQVSSGGASFTFDGWSHDLSADAATTLVVPEDDVSIVADYVATPITSTAYRQVWVPHTTFAGPCDGPVNTFYAEVGPCDAMLAFDLPADLTGYTHAEVIVHLTRNGAVPRARAHLNDPVDNPARTTSGGVFVSIPSHTWSRSTWTIDAPVAALSPGSNTLRLSSLAGTSFDIYDVELRLFGPAADLAAPTGRLAAVTVAGSTFDPALGGDLVVDDETVVLSAAPDGDVARVEFLARYDGFDVDGDGLSFEFHEHVRPNFSDGGDLYRLAGGTSDHAGTALDAPWQVAWDTSQVPTQPEVTLAVRLVGRDGFVRDVAGGPSAPFSLTRTAYSVQSHVPPTFEDGPLAWDDTSPPVVVSGLDIPDVGGVQQAWLLGKYLENPFVKVNTAHKERVFANPGDPGGDRFLVSRYEVPVDQLGTGDVRLVYTQNGSQRHLIEQPGPMMVVRRAGGGPLPLPVIESGPTRVEPPGSSLLMIEVKARTGTPPHFQWRRDGTPVPGETGARIVIDPVTDPGTYTVAVTNRAGTVESDAFAVDAALLAPERVVEGLIAEWDLVGGSGTVIADTAGSGVDLVLDDADSTTWLLEGLRLDEPTALRGVGAVSTLIERMMQTQEFSLEFWGTPASVDQDGPARMVTISGGPASRNVTLGQGLWGTQPRDLFDVRVRTNRTDVNGIPSLSTPAGVAAAERTHVVVTRNIGGPLRIYVDGSQVAEAPSPGSLIWDTAFDLLVGSEVDGTRPWLGTVHLLALYDRGISVDGVRANFRAGLDLPAPPVILNQPQSIVVDTGDPATFGVLAGGDGPISYQWFRDGIAVPGAIGDELALTTTTLDDDTATFTVEVANVAGVVTSEPAVLIVRPTAPPLIDAQPESVSVAAGEPVVFAVVASGPSPLSFQWFRGADAIDGATGSSLSLPSVGLADDGAQFSVVVSNPNGSVESSAAVLSVVVPPSGTGLPDGRFDDAAVALWSFVGGSLTDVESGLTLVSDGAVPVSWLPGGGVELGPDVGLSVPVSSEVMAALLGSGDVTVEAWVRADSVPSPEVGSLVQLRDGSAPLLSLSQGRSRATTNRWAGLIRSNTTYGSFTSSAGAVSTDLVHVALVRRNGKYAVLYVDGRPVGQRLVSGVLSARGNDFQVRVGGNGDGFAGDLFLLGFHSRALSGDELIEHTRLGPPSAETSPPPAAPAIVSGPADASVAEGSSAAFSVDATGSALSFQWFRGADAIDGATGSSLSLPSVGLADDGAQFSVVVSNPNGSVESSAAVLSVVVPPSGTGLPDGRFDDAAVALWSFVGGSLTDVESGLTLVSDGAVPVSWLPGGGVELGPDVGLSVPVSSEVMAALLGSGDVTVEAWVRADSVPSPEVGSLVQLRDGSAPLLSLSQGRSRATTNRWAGLIRSNTTYGSFTSSAGAVSTDLVHVALVRRNGKYAVLYVDGRRVGQRLVAGVLSRQGNDFEIRVGGDGDGFAGDLFLLGLHSRALSDDELIEHTRLGPPSGP